VTQEIVATLIVFGLVVLVMAIGPILGRAPLRGSCGGPGQACPCSDAEKRRCERRAGGR